MAPSPKRHILFLARWYPNRHDPMPGLFIQRHALSVTPWFDVSTLSVHLDFARDIPVYELVTQQHEALREVRVYYRAMQSRCKWLNALVNNFRFSKAHFLGYRLIAKLHGHPALIHVNVLTRCGLVALWLKITKSIPYVITEHWTRYLPGMGNFKGRLRQSLTRMVAKRAEAILPVTLNLQNAMCQWGLTNPNYRVIPNVVDTQMFRPTGNLSPDPIKTILHVSCFEDKQKNIRGLLRTLKQLQNVRCDWRAILVGEGIHWEILKDFAQELNFKEGSIEFTGLKENEELAKLMQEADFQVLFSRYENLPVVIPESFACGVPFVSTDVGGIREHLLPSLGRLVPSEDESALLAALDGMLDDCRNFHKQDIRHYALSHFSKEVIGNEIKEVYNKVILSHLA